MEIRPSLRLFSFISIVLLGSVMAIGFSLLSVNYYIGGLDKGLNEVMHDIARTTEVEDGRSVDVIGFNVARRWEDMPEIIQKRFGSPPEEVNQLQKLKDQSSIFSIPENIYFVVLADMPEGGRKFVSRIMLERDRVELPGDTPPKNRLYWALFSALLAIAVFSFILFMIMQKIARPVESLKNWAKSMDQDNIQSSPPDFSYSELNVLASLIQSSLISAHQSLEREQNFLSYASHELRTPISVIRSNVDLLQRLSEKCPLSEKQQQTLQRIERAGLTMSDLTETLLWLSRDDEQDMEPEPLALDEKINFLCDELNYLLNNKDVDVDIEVESFQVNVRATACHIVLSNLIRNAYQHTQYGQVKVIQSGRRVTIVNRKHKSNSPLFEKDSPAKKVATGYGLGLQLSEKIIKRHGWFYEISDEQGRYQVTVDFCDNSRTS